MIIRPFRPSDFGEARALWEASDGVGLSSADEPDAVRAFLERNPGLSFVATDPGVVGTILCGHDGRRGLIHHLVAAPSHRRRGVATALLQHGLEALRREGIAKCHLLVYRTNEAGLAFWRKVGADERTTLSLFSIGTDERR
jgi:ribosomal protein S18 acetylase RimI-like enzyme